MMNVFTFEDKLLNFLAILNQFPQNLLIVLQLFCHVYHRDFIYAHFYVFIINAEIGKLIKTLTMHQFFTFIDWYILLHKVHSWFSISLHRRFSRYLLFLYLHQFHSRRPDKIVTIKKYYESQKSNRKYIIFPNDIKFI